MIHATYLSRVSRIHDERFAAFCRVVALGQANHADDAEVANGPHAARLTRNSHQLIKTAEDLEHAAASWRRGELD